MASRESRSGTAFKLFFRPTDEHVVSAQPAIANSPIHGHETILLVEDNDLLRPLVAEVLESYGYTVIRATNGLEALAFAREHSGPFVDLVVTDVVMPGMNGRELAETLDGEYPGLRVLFTSGYPADAVIRRGIAEGRTAFIQKPFLADELAGTVRRILNDTNQPAPAA